MPDIEITSPRKICERQFEDLARAIVDVLPQDMTFPPQTKYIRPEYIATGGKIALHDDPRNRTTICVKLKAGKSSGRRAEIARDIIAAAAAILKIECNTIVVSVDELRPGYDFVGGRSFLDSAPAG